MPIQKVTLKNYKTHRHTEVPLLPLTVLVGPNSVGKTSVLDAIAMVSELAHPGVLSGPRIEPDLVLRRGEKALRVSLDLAAPYPGLVEFGIDRTDDGFEALCAWERGRRKGSQSAPLPALLPDPDARQLLSAVFGLQGAKRLRLDHEHLAAPSAIEVGEQTTALSETGHGLAGVLSVAKLFQEPVFDQIVTELRAVVPSVEGVRVVRSRFKVQRTDENGVDHSVESDGAELRIDFVSARDVPARAASEGTLLALGLLTVVHFFPLPQVVLFDDLERALHPRAQRELVHLLRRTIEHNPGLQLVATTHSPYLVDEFSTEEVIVCALRPDGTTAARRLSEHPRAEQAMKLMSTGEFLAATEEQWVAGEGGG
ncbi:MAG: AAA family ATPase [Deltaproteobacteria bacterium]|nr:AAA family ATPase [Deltaproteobacteria bacterium]